MIFYPIILKKVSQILPAGGGMSMGSGCQDPQIFESRCFLIICQGNVQIRLRRSDEG